MSDTKRCTGPCGQVKLLAEYPTRGGRARSKCRECTNKYQRDWEKRQKDARLGAVPLAEPETAARPAAPDCPSNECAIRGVCTRVDCMAPSKWPTVERFDAGELPDEPEPEDDPLIAMATYGTAEQRAAAESLLREGSVEAAARSLDMAPEQLRYRLGELHRTSARRGYSPAHDMTKPTPLGFHVKGVSTYYKTDPDTGEVRARGQWVKTKADEQHKVEALLDALSGLADQWKGKADPATLEGPANTLDEDLLCVYPMGDPHLGMYAWGQETGADFDLAIAERNLCAAVDRLVHRAPRAKQALIINLGDFFHADSSAGTTTKGTRVDVDTRWGKVLRVGIRAMRRCIDRALEKHETVRVICEIGNHDDNSSVMLALALEQFYEREPRVEIDTSPAKFHWHRFGAVLICTTHGDTCKMVDLPSVMACDRAADWGETTYRYGYTGHVHHDSLKEFPGVIVESFRTLAPRDRWHDASGYRSGQDMKCDVMHKRYGRIERAIVSVRQLTDAFGKVDANV